MPGPYLIGTAGALFTQQVSQHNGPFVSGANRYACFRIVLGPDDYAAMYRSADSGQTWSEADSGNHPALYIATSSAVRLIDVQQLGSTLHVAYLDTSGAIRVKQFSTATNTWGSTTAAGPVVGVIADPFGQVLSLTVRSGGDYVVSWRAFVSANVGKTQAAVYSGGVWGSTFDVSTGGLVVSSVLDSTNRSHFKILQNGDLVAAPLITFLHRSLDSSNSLSPADVTIVNNVQNSSNEAPGLLSTYTYGGTEKLAFAYPAGLGWADGFGAWPADPTDVPLLGHKFFVSAPVAASPTFTSGEVNYLNSPVEEETVSLNGDFVCTSNGGTVHLFWLGGNANYKLHRTVRLSDTSWPSVNTVAYSTVGHPLHKNIFAVQGQYSAAVGKHCLLLGINNWPSGFGWYYHELS